MIALSTVGSSGKQKGEPSLKEDPVRHLKTRTEIFYKGLSIDKITKCEDSVQFLELLCAYSGEMISWKALFMEEMEQRKAGGKRKMKELASYCGVTASTVRRWKDAVPKQRRDLIALGMFWGYSLEEINLLLTVYAGIPRLYSRNPCDVIFIYMIYNHLPYAKYDSYRARYIHIINEEVEIAQKAYVADKINTAFLDAALKKVKNDRQLDLFMDRYQEAFRQRYHGLFEFLQKYIKATGTNVNAIVRDRDLKTKRKYNRAITELKHKGIVPKRNVLLALAVHLNMKVDDINFMLRELAGLSELCPKNPLDAVLLFVLEDLYLNDPLAFNDISRELRVSRSPKIAGHYSEEALAEKELFLTDIESNIENEAVNKNVSPEIWEYFMNSEGGVYSVEDYVKYRMKKMGITDAAVGDFLSLL